MDESLGPQPSFELLPNNPREYVGIHASIAVPYAPRTPPVFAEKALGGHMSEAVPVLVSLAGRLARTGSILFASQARGPSVPRKPQPR